MTELHPCFGPDHAKEHDDTVRSGAGQARGRDEGRRRSHGAGTRPPIRLPETLAAWLRAESDRRGLPLATLIRMLLIEAKQRAQ